MTSACSDLSTLPLMNLDSLFGSSGTIDDISNEDLYKLAKRTMFRQIVDSSYEDLNHVITAVESAYILSQRLVCQDDLQKVPRTKTSVLRGAKSCYRFGIFMAPAFRAHHFSSCFALKEVSQDIHDALIVRPALPSVHSKLNTQPWALLQEYLNLYMQGTKLAETRRFFEDSYRYDSLQNMLRPLPAISEISDLSESFDEIVEEVAVDEQDDY